MLDRSSRVRAFTGPQAEQRAERVGNWFKAVVGNATAREWCVENGIGLTRATTESGGNTAGGFLAPPDFDAAIITVRETVGAFRRGAENRPARSDGQVRPRWFGGLTANFVAEGAAIPESSFQLDAVGANLKKIAILGRASSELFEDSAADLGEFLTSEIGYAFAAKEDDCGFNGDGTSAFSGISGLATKLAGLKSSITATGTGIGAVSAALPDLISSVIAAAVPGSAWYTSSAVYGQAFCSLAATNGGLTATMRPDGTIDANFLGFPVKFSDKLLSDTSAMTGKAVVFFGNLAMSSVIVERQQQTVIAISYDRALDKDQVLVRGVQRADIINHSVGDASTRGPIAVLVGG